MEANCESEVFEASVCHLIACAARNAAKQILFGCSN